MDEDPAKVAIILFETMVQCTNMRLVQEAQHMLLELATAFTRDNFNQRNAFRNRFLHHPIELALDPIITIIDIVEIQDYFGHRCSLSLEDV
jgi:hypothetical protein